MNLDDVGARRFIDKAVNGFGGRLPPPIDRPLKSKDDGDMEARLSEVEKSVVRIGVTLDHVGKTLDRIEQQVTGFKWQVFAAAVAVLLAAVASFFSIQQMTVATFQAATQTPQQPQQAPIIINVPSAAAPVAPRASGP